MFLLAQSAPAGTDNWLATLFYLVGGITAVVVLIKQFRKEPVSETLVSPQPLVVKPHEEYASRKEHDALVVQVRDQHAEIRTEIQTLREERSKSVGNLHQRIEAAAQDNRTVTDSLRKEVKQDIAGVHTLLNEQLRAFSKLEGRIEEALKKTQHPFPS